MVPAIETVLRPGRDITIALIVAVGLFLASGSPVAVADPGGNWVATVVSIQGEVKVRKRGTQQWRWVSLNDRFHAGDVVTVGANSRAGVVLKNESTLRVDQQSTLVFSEPEPQQPFLIELLNGAVHFFSRVHRSLHLVTPFVNGTVEGTEFFARVEKDHTTITLFEGHLKVFNAQGRVDLGKGQRVVAAAQKPPVAMAVVRPRDAVHWTLYYPAIVDFKPDDVDCGEPWCAAARQSVAAWRRSELNQAFAQLERVPETVDDPRWLLYRAVLRLTVGRADQAVKDLEKALSSPAQRSDAMALLSVTALVQNQKATARDWIDQALAQPGAGSAAYIASSYVQQAGFDLDAAIDAASVATQKAPGNALAWARLAELYLSAGDRTRALSAARRASALEPDLAHTLSVLGFAHLAQIRIDDAKQAFNDAIAIDSAAPLARLGLGLAKIRSGQLAQGRGQIEIAASLNPSNALIRSYLGKAYYEEKRDDPAAAQLVTAKALDPADPTPWFYDAIRKQSINRPVEALEDLQQSIALNDNRAVFRSRLLLDEDLAARSAGLARIYSDLGFQQLALVEGWKSLNTDPSNFSAHRFLADSYSVLPRHEIARVSELLQAQLLQPININPVGPNQAESQLGVFQGSGPTSPSFNEFNSLFERNRAALQASGVVGENSTWGNEVVLSGVYDRLSFSLGQFHQETDGFRENNGLKQNIYNAFVQASLTSKASIQAEVRSRDTESGDLELLFDPEQFQPNLTNNLEVTSYRLGGRYAFSPGSKLIASFIGQKDSEARYDRISETIYIPPPLDLSFDINTTIENKEETGGHSIELQHIYQKQRFNLVTGAGVVDGDFEGTIVIASDPPSDIDGTRNDDADIRHGNVYVYSQVQALDNLVINAGISYDDFAKDIVDTEQINPKLGLTWQPFNRTTVRAAAFRVLTRTLLNDQTVEPTQVAGFNQFFRDTPGADIWSYGGAVDQRFSTDVYGGVELTLRDLDIPYKEINATATEVRHIDWNEHIGRGYLYWTPHPWVVGSVEYLYEDWDRGDEYTSIDRIKTLTTHRLGLGGSFFHPTGIFARIKATYADQSGEFWGTGGNLTWEGSDQFWVVDAAVGYRLPKRYGLLTVEFKNLFDEEFNFQDTDPANPTIYPERMILGRLTLSF